MSLATAIEETMRAHELTAAGVARRLGWEQDRATFYRMLGGRTKEPRLGTLVQLCIALETTPSELLELAGVWSPDTPGQATPNDLRLRGAFGQVRALPVAIQQRAVPLVEALATGWLTDEDEQSAGDPDRRLVAHPPRRQHSADQLCSGPAEEKTDTNVGSGNTTSQTPQ